MTMNHQNETSATRRWDAGDFGCGQLAVGLKREIATLSCGDSLEVIAINDGAPADVPAWCRITGNALVAANHPVYVIRKGENHD